MTMCHGRIDERGWAPPRTGQQSQESCAVREAGGWARRSGTKRDLARRNSTKRDCIVPGM